MIVLFLCKYCFVGVFVGIKQVDYLLDVVVFVFDVDVVMVGMYM